MPTDAAASIDTTALSGGTVEVAPEGAADTTAVPEVKAADVKPGDEAKVEAGKVVPAEIVLKLPEGINPKDPQLEQFRAIAQAEGIKPEAAQKIADLYFSAQKAAADGALNSESNQKSWGEALKADKEFGGPKFDSNVKIAQRAIEKYGSSELKSFLQETGLGDHPELVRAFYRAGKAIAEDSIAGSSSNGASREAEWKPESMYPNTKFSSSSKE